MGRPFLLKHIEQNSRGSKVVALLRPRESGKRTLAGDFYSQPPRRPSGHHRPRLFKFSPRGEGATGLDKVVELFERLGK